MFAVVDLGSNSFHLLIAQLSGEYFQVVDRCSKKIQLAEGICKTGQLTDDAITRGLACLQEFKSLLNTYPIQHLRVVATQALRTASNAQIFMDKAKEQGFNVEIISGEQEAGLIYRGVSDPLPDSPHNRLVFDIGGASTEIAIGNNGKILTALSLDMGCVSWRDHFFSEALDYPVNGHHAKAAALAQLEPHVASLQAIGWQEAYASSGSAKMLASIARSNGWNNGHICQQCVHNIEQQLEGVTHSDDIQLAGLGPERRELLAPGLSIFATILDALSISRVSYSQTALREGILSAMSNRRINYQLQQSYQRV